MQAHPPTSKWYSLRLDWSAQILSCSLILNYIIRQMERI